MSKKPIVRVTTDGTVKLTDGFVNLISGLGGGNAKMAANTYMMDWGQQDLEAAYRTSTWFGKIVEIPADDATREWRSWQAESSEIEDIEIFEKKMKVRQAVRQALIWARLYGGAIIIPIGLPGTNEQPLNFERIRQGQVKGFSVLNRWEVQCEGLIRDPLDLRFGEPEYYTINTQGGNQLRIHASRTIRFNGRRASHRLVGDDSWGDSIWVRMRDAITSSDAGAAVIGALMQEAKIDVVKLPNLMAGMATTEYEALMMNRWRMTAMLKSVSNVLMLDGEDEWNQKQISWNGLPDVMMLLLTIMSGAADIPVTRLVGTSAKGMNATGEGDLKNYYDSVKAKQELELDPAIEPLNEIIIRSALGDRPDDVWYKWRSLFQLSDKEASEIDKADSETARNYSVSGLLPSEALEKATQNRMIESGRWPGLDAALQEAQSEPEEGQGEPNEDPEEESPPEDETLVGDTSPRTLYVRRDVLNASEIIAHFKKQGFKTTLPADDMHVTITFSRAPVDWMKMGENWSGDGEGNLTIQAGGPRMMDRLGENGDAVVLLFSSTTLQWRHEDMKRNGARWDWHEYQPHITISYEFDGDINEIEPWKGAIELGPEIFEEVKENWKEGINEDHLK